MFFYSILIWTGYNSIADDLPVPEILLHAICQVLRFYCNQTDGTGEMTAVKSLFSTVESLGMLLVQDLSFCSTSVWGGNCTATWSYCT